MPRSVLVLVVVLLLGGCDRPFVEPTAPTLEVLEPEDLDRVRTEAQLPLAVRASSFRAVDRVEVNGESATFLASENVFLDTLQLVSGLNTIRVEAFDVDGTVGTDTLYAVYLPYAFAEIQAHLPARLGGHAATPLADGSFLITGGASGVGEPAQDGAFRFEPATFAFEPEPGRLHAARVGHTASLLPDGRVLIVGGSGRVAPSAASDFVTTVELFDPEAGTFTEIPLVDEEGGPAPPIQRTDHSAVVLGGEDGRPFVYLYGGLVPPLDGEGAVPTEFMRTLRFEADLERLVAVGPRDRFRFVPIAGHTQTPLADVGVDGFGHYLVAGTSLPDGSGLHAPFVFAFGPDHVDAAEADSAAQARTDHAAAPLGDLVLVAGGRVPETFDVLRDGEVFAPDAARLFHFSDDLRPVVARWGHTATNLGDGRILLVGGFSASGTALDRSELFRPANSHRSR